MSDARPDPDALLTRVQNEEARARRGKLKVFFGYAAGVGKTYAMLESARREKAAGVDVVVGYVEPHARPETEALLVGLDVLPTLQVDYRGMKVREFDLDAVLKRRPQLILVDELAHTNADGVRHAKRWQDVEELLEAGIDVYTTLNVQHIESLNDVVAQVSGVIVRETLPDAVFEKADEIELVDIAPDELVTRLRQGKVYIPAQAERALQNFFQKANLAALRELALRRSADRINVDVLAARDALPGQPTWATSERLLVCVGASPSSAKVLRSSKRMAAALHADWIAANVETSRAPQLSPDARHRLAENLNLARQLGAETVTLTGETVAEELVTYARLRNVTKIIIGKTDEPRWKVILKGSVIDDLLRLSGEIDVYVIRGEEGPQRGSLGRGAAPFRWQPYAWTGAVVSAAACIAWLMQTAGLSETNLVMVFLLDVVFVAARFGRGPGIAASLASVLVFDFVFVPPYGTFAVSDAQYVLTFGVMLVVAILISSLTARFREQVQASRRRERRTESLYQLSRRLAGVVGTEFLIGVAWKQLTELFGPEIVLFLPDEQGKMQPRCALQSTTAATENNRVVAQWVYEHGQMAGAGTDTLPSAAALLLPLVGSQRTVGVLGVNDPDVDRLHSPEQRQLMETCASLIALAIERDQVTLEAQEMFVQAEAERLRSSLLSSVSHDLRTPLAAIAGASSSLLNAFPRDGTTNQRELLQSILDESKRLTRLVDNLLEMTRIETVGVTIHRQWHVLEEIIGSALGRLEEQLDEREVICSIPANLPLVPVDDLLLEQVMINLLENACKYTPSQTPLEITAKSEGPQVVVSIADHGPGLAKGEEQRVFEKFYRGANAKTSGRHGAGLGLAICRAIVEAHGGQIRAENRAEGGAIFWFTIPMTGSPPKISLDESTATTAA